MPRRSPRARGPFVCTSVEKATRSEVGGGSPFVEWSPLAFPSSSQRLHEARGGVMSPFLDAGPRAGMSRKKTTAVRSSVKRRLRPWMLLCWPKVEGWRIEGLGRWVSLASELAGALTRTNSHAARQESPGLIHRASPYQTPPRHLPFSLSRPAIFLLSPSHPPGAR